MLISEINLVDDTFGDFSGKRVIFKEHVERFSNSRGGIYIMWEFLFHHFYRFFLRREGLHFSIWGGARPVGKKLGQMALMVIFSPCKPAFSPILLAKPIHPNFEAPY